MKVFVRGGLFSSAQYLKALTMISSAAPRAKQTLPRNMDIVTVSYSCDSVVNADTIL